MSYVNNWADTDWCNYAWCAPTGTNVLKTQVRSVIQNTFTLGTQVRIITYNTTNLRFLWEIMSDGTTANNYTASSSAGVDKAPINLKSDIVEKYWQSTGITAEWIQFDAGVGKVISMDTFAVIDHNLTTSAVVNLRGSGSQSDAAPGDWTVVPVYATLPLVDDPDEKNLLYVSPHLPTSSFRHWRLEIADTTNPAPYLRIGRILGGSSLVFAGENCLDTIDYNEQSYKDEFKLNGFSTISNNRALKKAMKLSFKNLDTVAKTNYKLLKRYLRYNRDTLKALVIVDPSSEVLKYKFTIFAKLKQMPNETHLFIDTATGYTTFDLEYDEAR
jgi:hypothetical protein